MVNFTSITGGFVGNTQSSRNLTPNAVLFQLALMSAVSVVTLLAFEVLRPNNKIVYQPKCKYFVGDKRPPPLSTGPLSWIPPLIHTKEPELLASVGLDAVTYLRFLRMLRWMFLIIAIVSCGVLIPINVIFNLKNVDGDQRNILTMMTITNLDGNLLFAHVAVSWVICFIVMFFCYTNQRAMVRLRHMWFRSPEYQKSFYARTLMVWDVPKKLQSDAGLISLFEALNIPYPTTAVHIGRRVGDLPQHIEAYNDTVRELEQVLVGYLKSGRIGKRRPVLTHGGFLGIGGKKYDAIDYYTEKLRAMEASIERKRDALDTQRAENYGFASMGAVPYAHIVAAQLRGKKQKGATISMAPNPKDIIWKNMNASPATLARNRTIGWTLLVLFCFFNTVPLLIVSLLANLTALAAYVRPIANWQAASPHSLSLVSGVLPPSVQALFAVLFPVVLRKLSKYQGALTRSALDRSVVARYFAFLIISQLVFFTLIGVLFTAIQQIVNQIGDHDSFRDILNNLHTLPEVINGTYIGQSSYWLTWFPLRGFLSVFDLAQIVHLCWITFKTKAFGRTPRDIREWTQPPDFEYATYYANLLFMCAVALVFAPLAPLVAALAAIVFMLSSFVYKYQIMFVFTTKVESGGRIWNVVVNRLLVCVVFMQLLMVLTIGLQMGFKSFRWISTVPPLLILLIFKIYLGRAFETDFNFYVPTREEIANAQVHTERSDTKAHRLQKRFGHPALHAELFTPMVHSTQTPLLAQVYSGRMADAETKMDEFGGEKREAKIVGGGLKIAGIDQSDLEYDPALYQRDRGELDWDARSMSSSTYLGDATSVYAGMPGRELTSAQGFSNYLAHGPRPGPGSAFQSSNTLMADTIEMSRFPTQEDQAPLLQHQAPPMTRGDSNWSDYANTPGSSNVNLHYQQQMQHHQYPPPDVPPIPQGYLQQPTQSRRPTMGDGQAFREAPLSRPQHNRSTTGSSGFTGAGQGYR